MDNRKDADNTQTDIFAPLESGVPTENTEDTAGERKQAAHDAFSAYTPRTGEISLSAADGNTSSKRVGPLGIGAALVLPAIAAGSFTSTTANWNDAESTGTPLATWVEEPEEEEEPEPEPEPEEPEDPEDPPEEEEPEEPEDPEEPPEEEEPEPPEEPEEPPFEPFSVCEPDTQVYDSESDRWLELNDYFMERAGVIGIDQNDADALREIIDSGAWNDFRIATESFDGDAIDRSNISDPDEDDPDGVTPRPDDGLRGYFVDNSTSFRVGAEGADNEYPDPFFDHDYGIFTQMGSLSFDVTVPADAECYMQLGHTSNSLENRTYDNGPESDPVLVDFNYDDDGEVIETVLRANHVNEVGDRDGVSIDEDNVRWVEATIAGDIREQYRGYELLRDGEVLTTTRFEPIIEELDGQFTFLGFDAESEYFSPDSMKFDAGTSSTMTMRPIVSTDADGNRTDHIFEAPIGDAVIDTNLFKTEDINIYFEGFVFGFGETDARFVEVSDPYRLDEPAVRGSHDFNGGPGWWTTEELREAEAGRLDVETSAVEDALLEEAYDYFYTEWFEDGVRPNAENFLLDYEYVLQDTFAARSDLLPDHAAYVNGRAIDEHISSLDGVFEAVLNEVRYQDPRLWTDLTYTAVGIEDATAEQRFAEGLRVHRNVETLEQLVALEQTRAEGITGLYGAHALDELNDFYDAEIQEITAQQYQDFLDDPTPAPVLTPAEEFPERAEWSVTDVHAFVVDHHIDINAVLATYDIESGTWFSVRSAYTHGLAEFASRGFTEDQFIAYLESEHVDDGALLSMDNWTFETLNGFFNTTVQQGDGLAAAEFNHLDINDEFDDDTPLNDTLWGEFAGDWEAFYPAYRAAISAEHFGQVPEAVLDEWIIGLYHQGSLVLPQEVAADYLGEERANWTVDDLISARVSDGYGGGATTLRTNERGLFNDLAEDSGAETAYYQLRDEFVFDYLIQDELFEDYVRWVGGNALVDYLNGDIGLPDYSIEDYMREVQGLGNRDITNIQDRVGRNLEDRVEANDNDFEAVLADFRANYADRDSGWDMRVSEGFLDESVLTDEKIAEFLYWVHPGFYEFFDDVEAPDAEPQDITEYLAAEYELTDTNIRLMENVLRDRIRDHADDRELDVPAVYEDFRTNTDEWFIFFGEPLEFLPETLDLPSHFLTDESIEEYFLELYPAFRHSI